MGVGHEERGEARGGVGVGDRKLNEGMLTSVVDNATSGTGQPSTAQTTEVGGRAAAAAVSARGRCVDTERLEDAH